MVSRMYLHLFILFVIPLDLLCQAPVKCVHKQNLSLSQTQTALESCHCEGCSKVGVDGHNQYGVAQDQLSYANPFHLGGLLGVLSGHRLFCLWLWKDLWSFRRYSRTYKYCDGQPPPPKQSEFHCGCGRLFHTKGDLTRHQNTVPAEIVLLAQFRSRALLLPLDKPLKVNVEGRSPG